MKRPNPFDVSKVGRPLTLKQMARKYGMSQKDLKKLRRDLNLPRVPVPKPGGPHRDRTKEPVRKGKYRDVDIRRALDDIRLTVDTLSFKLGYR